MQFTFSFSDPNSWQNLTVVDVLINSAVDGRGACYFAFVPSSASSGSLFLVDDAGDAGGPYAGLVLPGSGTVSNNQCSISGAYPGFSSVAANGDTLALTLVIHFLSPAFAGYKVIYMAAREAQLSSEWQAMGSWIVSDASGFPQPGGLYIDLDPRPSGIGPSQTYSLVFGDYGGQAITVSNLLINSAADGTAACYVALTMTSATSATVSLVDDAGDAGGPYASTTVPGSGTVSNNQCSISAQGSTFWSDGNFWQVTLAVTLKQSFAGNRVVYVATRTAQKNSGWQAVTTVSPAAPTVTSVLLNYPLNPGSITVTGSNFQQGVACPAVCGAICTQPSIISLNNTDIPTTVVSATELKGVLPAWFGASSALSGVVFPIMIKNPVQTQCQRTQLYYSPAGSGIAGPPGLGGG